MPLVTQLPKANLIGGQRIPVRVDRHTLEKRRWRTQAEDGTDIAVDLGQPCHNGDVLMGSVDRSYVVEQLTEPVFRIAIPEEPAAAARLGWIIGNQHLPIEIRGPFILLAHDEQLQKKLERLNIHGEAVEDIFSPDPHSQTHHHH